ncbi:hypothetical protein M409DRAFT_59484 [Zasmidium cellare ATCC 36951]|uniref:Uncharacterized protein n=1 Tax=Zasmidium cellare ATCC 36951 TaxID=1080233 RepID=A0A6A6C1M5_ZASCE|nr:uncharacterized protein M409DRAFT_59484 [Zasmidium cellare ATCC 36951]KAF2160957.1 hypothetical protein M409DRAFT_59484 [Zasmidium cellare ATCC 36951]
MAPRKEPKESVVYPSSKRKTPAFKPLRPSKVPRTESESSVKPKSAAKKPAAKRAKSVPIQDSEEDEDDPEALRTGKNDGGADSEDEDSETLEDNPLAATTKRKTKQKPASNNAAPRRKTPTRDPSPMSISSHNDNEPPDDDEAAPVPSQSDSIPSIPQPLLVRLLHEAFADKNTKIDTHAIQVLQKYIEIFVREAIARTEAEKKEAAAKGECSDMDAGWLEVEDLEKVVAGLLLDF